MAEENKFGFLLPVWMVLGLLLTILTNEIATAQGTILALDSSVENFLFSIRSPFVLQMYSLLTVLGNTSVIIGLAGIVGIMLIFSKKNRVYVAGLITTLAGAAVTGHFMKILVERMRPEGLLPSSIESSFSFPSGHATASMAFYGFLIYMLCEMFPTKKSAILFTGIALIGSIGFSRLYLGVHFPTDVLAGYLLGGLWLTIGIAITKRTRRAMLQ